MIILKQNRKLTMAATYKITIDIPEELFNEISEYKKTANIADDNIAIYRLPRNALSLPEYFLHFDWEDAEKEADDDIKAGRTKKYSSVEELLSDLK